MDPNNPFHQEGITSINLREVIFRELVANIIAHREYTSAAPATLVINGDRVELKNPNVPHYFGRIDPNRFIPFPKNPVICKFMLQMGLYEELGSGVRRVNHYMPYYAPGAGKPVFEDGEMFTVTLPLRTFTPEVTPEVAPEVTPEVMKMLAVIKGDMGRKESQGRLGLGDEKHFRESYQQPGIALGLIEMTIPDKPRSRLQKYRLTDKGRKLQKREGKD